MVQQVFGSAMGALAVVMIVLSVLRLVNDRLFYDRHVMRRLAIAAAMSLMSAALWWID